MLTACGVQAYRVVLRRPPHEVPLTCRIKQCPEDFVVIEVDPTGQRTDDAQYSFDALLREDTARQPQRHEEDGENGKAAEQAQDDDAASEAAVVQSDMSLDDMRALVQSHKAALLQALGTREQTVAQAEQLSGDALAALVAHVRDTKGSTQAARNKDGDDVQPLSSPPCWWWEKTHTLPHTAPLDKAQRRMLHSVVSSTFVHLRSRSASSASSLGDVVAFVDPHYVFFTYLCGADVADQLACWAAQRSAAPHARDEGTQPQRTRLATSFAHETSEQVTSTLSGKELRRVFHAVLRRFYPYVRCSVSEGRVVLQYTHTSNSYAGKRQREATSDEQPQAGATMCVKMYSQLIIRKRNLDTAEMRSLVARHFAVPETSVCCAGMKDKLAVSYQRCSIPAASTGATGDASAATGDAQAVHLCWPSDEARSYCDVLHRSAALFRRPVGVGQLRGNVFRVRLRGLRPVTEAAGAIVDKSTEVCDTNVSLTVLRRRLARVTRCGFVNYFGQQRFSESVTALRDHTGLHLFAQDWVAAVRSLYRGCPDLYDGFPARMESRQAPGNARDVQCMTHALRQTYRMYFAEHRLCNEDVRQATPLWQAICQKAVCEAVPFALRALWVHAAQSLVFNVAASYVVQYLHNKYDCDDDGDDDDVILPAQWQELCLPMGGYSVTQTPTGDDHETQGVREAAMQHTLQTLGLSAAQLYEQRRVAGVPVPGSWRPLFVLPRDVTLDVVKDGSGSDAGADVTLGFYLPSSSYATIFLRELHYNDTWW